MGESKTAITGAIATFKDLGYTLGPLAAGALMGFISVREYLFHNRSSVRTLNTYRPSSP
jgi:hypothetical protein